MRLEFTLEIFHQTFEPRTLRTCFTNMEKLSLLTWKTDVDHLLPLWNLMIQEMQTTQFMPEMAMIMMVINYELNFREVEGVASEDLEVGAVLLGLVKVVDLQPEDHSIESKLQVCRVKFDLKYAE